MRLRTSRAVAVAALVLAAGVSGGAMLSVAAAQEIGQPTPVEGQGYGYTKPPTTKPPTTMPPTTKPPTTMPPTTWPPTTAPPTTAPPTTAPPTTAPPTTAPPTTAPPTTAPPHTTAPPDTTSPPETVPPDGGNGLPVTGMRSLTVAGLGLVLIGLGLVAWLVGGRRRVRV